MPEYKECYIAFLDLLGFKKMIGEKSCTEIVGIFEEIKRQYVVNRSTDIYGQNGQALVDGENIHIKIMSDSICIYIYADLENALPSLVLLCAFFQVRMFQFTTPIFVRGGIAQGNIYSDGDIIFGNGLVNAYLLEEKNAKFPRIILTRDIVDNCMKCDDSSKMMMQGFLKWDFDSFLYIDYWIMFCAWEEKNGNVNKLYDYIESVLSTTYDESIRAKYNYAEAKLLTYYHPEEQNA